MLSQINENEYCMMDASEGEKQGFSIVCFSLYMCVSFETRQYNGRFSIVG